MSISTLMDYISTKGKTEPVSFKDAVLHGLAGDGGLYVPREFPELPASFWDNISGKTLPEIGFEIARRFLEEPGDELLKKLLADALNFDAPLIHLKDDAYILELFHGPTMAFKDFGARFMSRIFQAVHHKGQKEIIILAATSGDTGSAVAHGFLGVEGIKVCLLYPSGQVSRLQEQQITTVGGNVTALEVKGTFDDCQKMVKQAFSDPDLTQNMTLSSANSINIARLIPQTFYYAYALAQLNEPTDPVFVVPSGNFGNLTAGLWAQKTGMPARGFIAATNANNIIPEYLKTGIFSPKPSRQTISNAMDVGNPSNFGRISDLYNNSLKRVKDHIWGATFSDDQTRLAIKKVHKETGYVLDPHTAVGYLGYEKFKSSGEKPFGAGNDTSFVVLSTAHPAKFAEAIEPVIGKKISMPEQLAECLGKEKKSIELEADSSALKRFLQINYG